MKCSSLPGQPVGLRSGDVALHAQSCLPQDGARQILNAGLDGKTLILPFTRSLAMHMLGAVVAILAIVAAVDYLFQYRPWFERHCAN